MTLLLAIIERRECPRFPGPRQTPLQEPHALIAVFCEICPTGMGDDWRSAELQRKRRKSKATPRFKVEGGFFRPAESWSSARSVMEVRY
jgi:hypothetical protein